MSEPQWLQLRERGSVAGIRLFVVTVLVFGRATARAMLWPVMFYYFLLSPRARRVSREFQHRLGLPGRWQDTFAHLMNFGRCTLDRLYFVRGKLEGFTFHHRSPDILAELRELERGAMFLGAHLGSFEALAAVSKTEALNVTAVINSGNARMMQAVLTKLNPELSKHVLDQSHGGLNLVFDVQERLNRGEHVALLADRCPPGERSVVVPFFGQPARFPTGMYVLAAASRCPVYIAVGLYRGGSTYELRAVRFAEKIVLPRKGRKEALEQWARKYAEELEKLVRQAPLNWFNFYDFWEPDDHKIAAP